MLYTDEDSMRGMQMGDLTLLPDGRLFLCSGAQQGKFLHLFN